MLIVGGPQTDVFIYVMGIRPSRLIQLSSNVWLEPDGCNPTGDEIVGITINAGDCSEMSLALATASLRRCYAQLHIHSENPEELVKIAWNSQWWCIALSAYLNTDIAFFFQSEVPLHMVASSQCLHAIVANLLPVPRQCRSISVEECNAIEITAPIIDRFMNDSRFQLAINALWGAHFHPRPAIQMATIWVGIESLFHFKYGKKKRLSCAIPTFLDGAVSEDEICALWEARSKAVHEGVLEDSNPLLQSRKLLADIIRKCVENGELPAISK